jgi:hypothetical protein
VHVDEERVDNAGGPRAFTVDHALARPLSSVGFKKSTSRPTTLADAAAHALARLDDRLHENAR